MFDPIQWRDPSAEMMSRVQSILDSVAGAALPVASDAAPIASCATEARYDATDIGASRAAGTGAKMADQLSGADLERILAKKEQHVNQAASEQAYQQGRGGQAIAEAEDAAQEFRWLTPTAMIKRLIDDRCIHESAAGDENLRKRVEHTMRERLKWPRVKRTSRPQSPRGAAAELAGKRQIGRQLAIAANTRAVEWCCNHGYTIAVQGEQFCDACMSRLSYDERQSILAGDTPREQDRLTVEQLALARQQALEMHRESLRSGQIHAARR